jgi:chromosome segregation ATPase
LNDDTVLRSLKSDLEEWIYREVQVKVKANEELGVYAGPDVSEETFQRQCQEAAADREAEAVDKERKRVETQIERVEKRLRDEERELREDEAELAARKREELTKHAETVFGFLTGRRRSVSSSMTKRRMTERAKADVEESEAAIKEFQRELEALREDLTRTVSEIEDRWDEIAADHTELPVSPYKKDILVTLFGIGWLPHYLVEDRGQLRELPAMAWESPPGG